MTLQVLQVANEVVPEDGQHSDLLTAWGQYIAHDLAFMPQDAGQAQLGEEACQPACENRGPCFPIQVSRVSGISLPQAILPHPGTGVPGPIQVPGFPGVPGLCLPIQVSGCPRVPRPGRGR